MQKACMKRSMQVIRYGFEGIAVLKGIYCGIVGICNVLVPMPYQICSMTPFPMSLSLTVR